MRSVRALPALLSVLLLAGAIGAEPVGAQTDPTELPETRLIVVVDGGEVLGVPSDQYVSGQDWVDGDVIEMYLNGVYIATSTAEPNDEGTASPGFLADELGFTLEPGDEVTLVRLSDALTYTHTVTGLAVDLANAQTDVVAGTAAAGSEVLVAAGGVFRSEIASSTAGAWRADFSVPGDQPWEASTFDIDADTVGLAVQIDESEARAGTFVAWAPTADPPGPTCDGRPATIVGTGTVVLGTGGDDVIVGTDASNIIWGRGGDDVICALDGNDIVLAGRGDDLVFGEEGRDRIYGGRGDDTLVGGPGFDLLLGGPGNDTTVQ